jgi:hypothetical protein
VAVHLLEHGPLGVEVLDDGLVDQVGLGHRARQVVVVAADVDEGADRRRLQHVLGALATGDSLVARARQERGGHAGGGEDRSAARPHGTVRSQDHGSLWVTSHELIYKHG